jgi:hypothetical protein
MVAVFVCWVCEEGNMTREDIIRMAHEANIPIEIDWAGRPSTLVIKDGGTYLRGIDDLERFAELVAAAEREACCAIVYGQCGSDNVAQRTVDAIQSRRMK